MLTTTNSWTPYIVGSALTVSILSVFIWHRMKKNYERVGKIGKLFFYPVKSLKAVEVTKGKCTKYGFEVNGVLDRSFMLVGKDGGLVTQQKAPSLVLLTPHISENYLIISGPNTKNALKVEIKKSPSPNDKIINCPVYADSFKGVDCGDEAASWFQSYLNIEGVRLVQFFSTEYTKTNPFYAKINKAHTNIAALHIMSEASVDDVNSKTGDTKITVYNFRPNILVEDCGPFAEDSWKYVKINEAECVRLMLTDRCLMTTNDPDTGVLSQKEPLVSLRKYRILAPGQKLAELAGSLPCLGTSCAVLSSGEIAVGDEIFAVVEEMPKMKEKET